MGHNFRSNLMYGALGEEIPAEKFNPDAEDTPDGVTYERPDGYDEWTRENAVVGWPLPLRMLKRNDDVSPISVVAGSVDLRWDDIFKAHYGVSPRLLSFVSIS